MSPDGSPRPDAMIQPHGVLVRDGGPLFSLRGGELRALEAGAAGPRLSSTTVPLPPQLAAASAPRHRFSRPSAIRLDARGEAGRLGQSSGMTPEEMNAFVGYQERETWFRPRSLLRVLPVCFVPSIAAGIVGAAAVGGSEAIAFGAIGGAVLGALSFGFALFLGWWTHRGETSDQTRKT